MSSHVLIVSLGPVQGLIAQARRTRDLWFGSFVLSEISKATARAIAGSDGAELVFPAFDKGASDLEPENNVRRQNETKPASVANKIVALVHEGYEPRDIAAKAREAARERLVTWGMDVFRKQTQLVDTEAAAAAAREQLNTLLEIRATWAAITGEQDYQAARLQAEEALAARKTLHAFGTWKEHRPGCFKSSLDGARPTVLKKQERTAKAWTEYRIGLREELDAVGLLKRTGGKTDQFVPVPNVGLAAWLDRAAGNRDQRDQLKQIATECKTHGFQRVNSSLDWVKAFPYDAQVMLAERWEPYFLDHFVRDPRAATHAVAETRRKAHDFGNLVQPLLDALGPPYPYVACLVADGDNMGRCIDELAEQGSERHRKLSAALTRFARDQVHRIVEKSTHRGVLIYAGGDDVLAFVCVQDALACALELKECFQKTLGDVVGPDTKMPTLSVGIGIGHVVQSLGRLLELGREAEKLAKSPGPVERALGQTERNAVALMLEKHSGMTWNVRIPWDSAPLAVMRDSVALLKDERLSTSKIHQVAGVLRRSPGPEPVPGASALKVLNSEVARVLSRVEAGALLPKDALLDLHESSYARSYRAVAQWIQRMLIANELYRADKVAPIRWPEKSEDAS